MYNVIPFIKKIFSIEKIIIFSIIVGLFFFFLNADFQKIINIRNNLHFDALLIASFLIFVNISIFIIRWYFLVKPVKMDVSLKNIYMISISAIAVNSASPGKLGVPTKAVLLKNLENVDINQSVPSLTFELFLDNFFSFAYD